MGGSGNNAATKLAEVRHMATITMKKLVSRANNISTCPAKPLEQVQGLHVVSDQVSIRGSCSLVMQAACTECR